MGIAPIRLILEKDLIAVGNRVTVNWEGKLVQSEILALSGKFALYLLELNLWLNWSCVIANINLYTFIVAILTFARSCFITDNVEVLNEKDLTWSSKMLEKPRDEEEEPLNKKPRSVSKEFS